MNFVITESKEYDQNFLCGKLFNKFKEKKPEYFLMVSFDMYEKNYKKYETFKN